MGQGALDFPAQKSEPDNTRIKLYHDNYEEIVYCDNNIYWQMSRPYNQLPFSLQPSVKIYICLSEQK